MPLPGGLPAGLERPRDEPGRERRVAQRVPLPSVSPPMISNATTATSAIPQSPAAANAASGATATATPGIAMATTFQLPA